MVLRVLSGPLRAGGRLFPVTGAAVLGNPLRVRLKLETLPPPLGPGPSWPAPLCVHSCQGGLGGGGQGCRGRVPWHTSDHEGGRVTGSPREDTLSQPQP